ncbi:13295_t:CDS:2 [Acaulospora morrowiae]|uniref:13295_t:CDS:1 n=1 Tax=Acaulospora morrowiae TaxID=94023 RepID=A0A9N8ZD28_9GLOM|nr:13295_t:CDS:2 [Acaulospora morrowiae]
MNVVITKIGISITNSDGVDSIQPTNGDLTSCYYRLIDNEEPEATSWLKKLGQSLAQWLRENGDYTINEDQEKLLNFPEGYFLYEYTNMNPDGTKSTDVYLFGAHKFRSPDEFAPHLKWLVSKESHSCSCVYCPVPSNSKTSKAEDDKAVELIPETNEMIEIKPDPDNIMENIPETDTKPVKVERNSSTIPTSSSRTSNSKQPVSTLSRSRMLNQIPSSEPLQHQINAGEDRPKAKYAEYRTGEIVWVSLAKTTEPDLIARVIQSNEENGISIENWPGVIYSRGKVAPEVDKVKFTVKLVVLNIDVTLRRTGLIPWKAYSPEIPDSYFSRVIMANQIDQPDGKIDENIQDYIRAVHRAHEAVQTYSPMKSFKLVESSTRIKAVQDPTEKERLADVKNYYHYEALMYGAEMIRPGDLVRLVPENQDNPEKEPEFPEFLEIRTIFKHPEKGMQLTGNILQRGELLNKTGPLKLEDYKWWISHDLNEEYTIDLEDIAGRFYLMMPHLTVRTNAHTFKKLNDRMAIIESGTDLEKSQVPVNVIPAKRTMAKLSTRIDNPSESPSSVKKQKKYIVKFQPKKRNTDKLVKKVKTETKS